MSTAQVARRRPASPIMYHNGFTSSDPRLKSANSSSSSPRNRRSNHRRSSFLYPNDHDGDSDPLNELEQQSPPRPPALQSNYSGPYSPNNQAVRQRLRRPIRSFPLSAPKPSPSPSPLKSPFHKRAHRKFPSHRPSRRHHPAPSRPQQSATLKIVAGVCLFVFAVSIYYFYGDLLTFSALKENHHSIIEFIDRYPVTSPLLFMCFECIVVGLTIPGATVLSMAAGTHSAVCIPTFNVILNRKK